MTSAPTNLLRVKDDWVQLAFLSLRKQQRDLVLLATIDLGPQDYFDRVVQLIKKREKRGFAIVCEDLQGGLGVNEEIQQLKETAKAGLQKNGFALLADVVRPEDYWTNVSAPKAGNGSNDLDAAQDRLAQTLRGIISDPEATAQALRTFPAQKELYDLYFGASATQLAARVAAAMLEQAAQYHVFACAGLHRAPAVIDAITAAGYTIVQEQWMDVMAVKHGGDHSDER